MSSGHAEDLHGIGDVESLPVLAAKEICAETPEEISVGIEIHDRRDRVSRILYQLMGKTVMCKMSRHNQSP